MMIKSGEELSADGIIGVGFSQWENRIMAYGTAVKLEDIV